MATPWPSPSPTLTAGTRGRRGWAAGCQQGTLGTQDNSAVGCHPALHPPTASPSTRGSWALSASQILPIPAPGVDRGQAVLTHLVLVGQVVGVQCLGRQQPPARRDSSAGLQNNEGHGSAIPLHSWETVGGTAFLASLCPSVYTLWGAPGHGDRGHWWHHAGPLHFPPRQGDTHTDLSTSCRIFFTESLMLKAMLLRMFLK